MSRIRNLLGVAAAVGGMLLGSSMMISPAQALTGVCPAAGFAADCNLLITISPSGRFREAVVDPTPYDGSEDQLVGVLNNSSTPISSLGLSGSFIFGFDGDGIDNYTGASNPIDTTGYGGSDTFFTIVDFNNGTANFVTPIAGGGGSTYFSLEEPPAFEPGVIVNPAPEPTSLAILGTALAGLGLMRRRRRTA